MTSDILGHMWIFTVIRAVIELQSFDWSFHVCKENFQHKLKTAVFYYNKYGIFLHKIYMLGMIHSCSLDSSACKILVGGISSS